MSKSTPGPWKIIDDDMDYIAITDMEQMYGICRIEESASESRSAMKADARLIAAAPELLEVLKKLHSMYSDFSRSSFDLVEIRSILKSAITKAEGGVR